MAPATKFGTLDAVWGDVSRIIAALAAVSAAFVLFGQTIFLAVARLSIAEHPSYPLWGVLFLFLIAALLSVARSADWAKVVRSFNPIDACFAGFVAIVLVSFVFEGPAATREFAVKLSALCVFPYVVVRLFSRDQAALFVKTALVAAAIGALIAALYVTVEWRTAASADRLVLFLFDWSDPGLGDPSASFLTVSLSLPLLFLVSVVLNARDLHSRRGRIRALLALTVLFAMSWWIVRGGSRSGMLALFAAVAFMIVFAHWQSWARRASVGALIGLMLVGSFILQPRERLDFLAQVPCAVGWLGGLSAHDMCDDLVTGSTSPGLRMGYLRDALPMVIGQPVFGVGAGNFGYRAPSSVNVPFASPHLLLIHVLAETGLFGLIAMTGLLLTTLWAVLRSTFLCRDSERWLIWMGGTIWVFFAGMENLTGNYFSALHLYALTGLVAAQASMVHPQRGSVAAVLPPSDRSELPASASGAPTISRSI